MPRTFLFVFNASPIFHFPMSWYTKDYERQKMSSLSVYEKKTKKICHSKKKKEITNILSKNLNIAYLQFWPFLAKLSIFRINAKRSEFSTVFWNSFHTPFFDTWINFCVFHKMTWQRDIFFLILCRILGILFFSWYVSRDHLSYIYLGYFVCVSVCHNLLRNALLFF